MEGIPTGQDKTPRSDREVYRVSGIGPARVRRFPVATGVSGHNVVKI